MPYGDGCLEQQPTAGGLDTHAPPLPLQATAPTPGSNILPFCENCRKLTFGAAAVPTASSSSSTAFMPVWCLCFWLHSMLSGQSVRESRKRGGQGYTGYTGYKGYTGYIQSTEVYGVYPEQGGIWGISSPRG